MSAATLSAVKAMLLGKIAHLSCKKVVLFRHLRLRALSHRVECLEKVLKG